MIYADHLFKRGFNMYSYICENSHAGLAYVSALYMYSPWPCWTGLKSFMSNSCTVSCRIYSHALVTWQDEWLEFPWLHTIHVTSILHRGSLTDWAWIIEHETRTTFERAKQGSLIDRKIFTMAMFLKTIKQTYRIVPYRSGQAPKYSIP